MHQKLHNLKSEAIGQILEATSQVELENLRIKYLGKNGLLNDLSQDFSTLTPEEKVACGRLFNEVKSIISDAITAKTTPVSIPAVPTHDLSLPGYPATIGIPHPITAVAREMNLLFQSLGFSVADGPEIETDEFNYNRLNLPADHPARDLQDSLYIKEPDLILRTHTSSVEAHLLADHTPPFRFVFPGKAYRYENLSATNHMMFFQYQGLAVGEHITLANLKWTLETFIKNFFGPQRKSRFRCKYYPEVEPGVGVDIDCQFCQQKGCSVCKQRGWIEMLGAGMIHPNMLRAVNIDPDKYSGFAWGMGLDRIAMAKYGINDIRALYNGSLTYNL
jgi:phenylalanyl-tRNA synthetase alpha chain